jgi:hypothetical protein
VNSAGHANMPPMNSITLVSTPLLSPSPLSCATGAKQEDVDFVKAALQQRGGAAIPNNFVPTVEAYTPSGPKKGRMPTGHIRSPQTTALLDLVGVPYDLDHSAPVSVNAGMRGTEGGWINLTLAIQ